MVRQGFSLRSVLTLTHTSTQESSISKRPPGISEAASNLLRHGDSELDHIHDCPADNGLSSRKRRADEQRRNPKRRRKLQKGSIPDLDPLYGLAHSALQKCACTPHLEQKMTLTLYHNRQAALHLKANESALCGSVLLPRLFK